jgi:hypothetical protein
MPPENLQHDLVRIVQDDAVQRLSVLLKRFNPFDVLRVGYYELRHTNTLAWLLDPWGNHGLGDTFLRAFIARLGSAEPSLKIVRAFETAADHSVTVRREVSLSQLKDQPSEEQKLGLVQDEDPSGTEIPAARNVRGKGKRSRAIDILLDGDGWVLGVEAKMRSGEGSNQLSDYLGALATYAGKNNKPLCPVYLTIDGEEASTEGWISASWREGVIDPLEKILDIQQDLRFDVRAFLTSYLQTLKRLAGDGDDAETLARQLSNQDRFAHPLNELRLELKKKGNRHSLDSGIERLLRRHAPVIRLLIVLFVYQSSFLD